MSPAQQQTLVGLPWASPAEGGGWIAAVAPTVITTGARPLP